MSDVYRGYFNVWSIFQMTDKCLAEFYAYLVCTLGDTDWKKTKTLPFSLMKYEDKYELNFGADEKDVILKILSALKYYGEIYELEGSKEDEYEYKEELYIWKDGMFQECSVEAELAYYEEAHYYDVKRYFLEIPNIQWVESPQTLSVAPQELQSTLRNLFSISETREEFIEQMNVAFGDVILEKGFKIDISHEGEEKYTRMNVTMSIFNHTKNGIQFYLDYANEILQDDVKPMEMNYYAMTLEDEKELILQMAVPSLEINQTLKLPLSVSQHLFNQNDVSMKLQVQKNWVEACTLCVNRLEKEINGTCNNCFFEQIDEKISLFA